MQTLLSGEKSFISFLRSSRAGFYFFATAKRSKQEMPSRTQTRHFLTMLKSLYYTGAL
jgi:hypothetical protein